jgi:hypothetical protein
MSAKQLLPNQHIPLHGIYGQNDCCLCHAEADNTLLRSRIHELEEALNDINKNSQSNIPHYAYGDNEAAVYMAGMLDRIELRAAKVLKGNQ